MLQLWRQRPVLVSAFLLAAALTLFFATRFAVQAIYWANPAHHQQPIEPWMTSGYIGKSWGIDPRALDVAAGLPLPAVKGHPQSMAEIAKDRGIAVGALIDGVQQTVLDLKAQGKDDKARQND